MKSLKFGTGLAVFIIFFGLALLDALWSGRLMTAGVWLIIGAAFLIADNFRVREGTKKH